MDVFGLGKDANLDPSLHFVLDEECASKLLEKGLVPQLQRPNSWRKYDTTLNIVLPHELKNTTVKVSIYMDNIDSLVQS